MNVFLEFFVGLTSQTLAENSAERTRFAYYFFQKMRLLLDEKMLQVQSNRAGGGEENRFFWVTTPNYHIEEPSF